MRIDSQNTLTLIVDIQERLFPHMYKKEDFLETSIKLVKGLKLLDIPILVNEQYKKGLGETIAPLIEELQSTKSFEKVTFSCCKNDSTLSEIRKLNKKFVIVFGIEAHICVLQTIIDLKNEGFVPVLVEDATTSRKPNDKEVAIKRALSEGAILTTCESLLFELCASAKHEAFRDISKLIK